MKHTPGPWSLCHDGKCPCMQVGSEHHPVCTVVSGTWGDTYPALRIVGGSLEQKAEPYIEQIPYGEIPKEVAIANGILISKAPEMYKTINDMIHWFIRNHDGYPPCLVMAMALVEDIDKKSTLVPGV